MDKIVDIINNKIKEHDIEIIGCETDILNIQKANKSAGPDIVAARKLMLLKDKRTFHSACKAVLIDLKGDIEKLK